MQVLTARTGGDGAGRGLQLEVRHTPASPRPPDTVPGFLKLTEGATLNLSCEVAGPDPAAAAEVSLSWYLPNHAAIDKQRLEQRGGEAGVGRSSLVIAPLMEADTGDYECWAQAPATSTQVKKILKVRTALCLTIEYCIPIMCARCWWSRGAATARRGSTSARVRPSSTASPPATAATATQTARTETTRPRCCAAPSPAKVGHSGLSSPLKIHFSGKIVCPELDFRCIDPTEYCCDPHVSPDTCKFMYPCCESVIEFSIRSRYYQSGAGAGAGQGEDIRGADLAYLHSTVYTVIGGSVSYCVAFY